MNHLELRAKISKSGTPARAPALVVVALTALLARCSVDSRAPDVFDDSAVSASAGSDNTGGQAGATSTVPEQGGSSSAQGGSQTSNGGTAAQDALGGSAGLSPGGSGSGAPTGGSTGQCSPVEPDCNGSGVALSPVNGWVTRDTNGLGVNGSFYVTSDAPGGPSTVTPTSFAASGTDICIQGVAGPIGLDTQGMPDYAGDWGVVLGLNLSQLAQGVRGPWSPSTPAGVVTGFSYVVTGPTIPNSLRFSVGTPDSQTSYCVNTPAASGATQTIQFQELATECWDPGFGTSPLPSEPLGNLQWEIPTVIDDPIPFDFCVSQLQGLIQ